MRILLTAINAKYIHTNLALRSIRAYVKERGFSCELTEFTINQQFDDILASIYREKPDLVAFSCYLWNITLIRRLCVELKKVLPNLIIWLGGPEVSYHSCDFLQQNPAVDMIMIGEGEETFYNLLAAYQQNKTLAEVNGIAYRKDGLIYQNTLTEPLDLATLPFAYDDLEKVKNKIIYFETMRGCPFHCSYCLSSVTPGVRFMPVEQACRYLTTFLQAKVKQVKFVDRTFNCNKVHAEKILSFLIQNDNGITNFHFEIAADILADSTIALIQSARKGLFQFEVGIQSTHSETLEAIHRSCDNRLVFEKVRRLLQPHNTHIHVDLIAGLPLENYETFAHSYDEVFSLKADMLQLGFLKVLKGSVMERDCQLYGIVAQNEAPYEVLQTHDLSYADILRLKQIELLNDRINNSGRFRFSLDYILKNYSSPFRFWEDLAEYFTVRNYWENAWGKYDLYRYLFEFHQKRVPKDQQLLWLIRHDIFSHENAKGIPSPLNDSLFTYYQPCIEAFWKTRKALAPITNKNVHIEIYPFSPITGEKGYHALLYQYSDCIDIQDITTQIPWNLSLNTEPFQQ